MNSNLPPRDHNNPPVVVPEETSVTSDLEARYPTVASDLADLESAAATYPERITDEETAQSLQALLKKMSSHKAAWKSWRSLEKKPWDLVGKIVMNFFSKPEERVEKLIDTLKPRYTAFLEMKAENERIAREAKAAAERAEAERLAREAEARRLEAEAAERREREAREREEAARLAEAEAKEDQLWAEARAELAKWEERQAEERRKAAERQEREENAGTIRSIKQFMRHAERMGDAVADGSILTTELEQFDDLILPGGEISRLAGKVVHSTLLDDDQKAYLAEVKIKLEVWRTERQNQLSAAAQAEAERRARAEALRQAKDAEEAAARAAQRNADQEATERAMRMREQAEADAAAAKEAAKVAKQEARGAAAEARDAYADQKEATRDATVLDRQAGKVDARADRMERRAENASDADLSRTRGEYGTVGSLSGKWEHLIEDRDSLIAYFGPLGIYLMPDAMDAAVYRFMREHQKEFTEERVTGLVPGVAFQWTPDARIV